MINFILGYVLGVVSLMFIRVLLFRLNKIAREREIERQIERVRQEIDSLTDIKINNN